MTKKMRRMCDITRRFDKVQTETLSVSKIKSFVIVRLMHSRFEFWLDMR